MKIKIRTDYEFIHVLCNECNMLLWSGSVERYIVDIKELECNCIGGKCDSFIEQPAPNSDIFCNLEYGHDGDYHFSKNGTRWLMSAGG